ncbi:MAG: GIY-YIG nuclease family protein [Candidatus Uhrbacteria bacterium]|nr:GIY-YIG nuclease family protein [Candidatus Uhrbacteria bacterium]
MHTVYVIKSDAFNRIYIGTTEDVNTRLAQHNAGKTRSTKPYCPWRQIYSETFEDKSEALRRERQIKQSGLIRNALRNEDYRGPIV